MIRVCTEADVEDVSRVLFESGLAKTEESAPEIFLKELKRGDRYLLAFLDGKPVGVASWIFHGEARHGLAELYHVGVSPGARRKGIGLKLLQAVVDDAEKFYEEQGCSLRKLYLLTHEDNTGAQALYEKFGMARETMLKDHFRKGLGEAVYSRFFD